MIVYINRRKNNKVFKSDCYYLQYIGAGTSNIDFNLSEEDTVFIHLPVGSSKQELFPLSWSEYLEDNDKQHLINVCNNFEMKIVKFNSVKV
jgi:hypothetical protein